MSTKSKHTTLEENANTTEPTRVDSAETPQKARTVIELCEVNPNSMSRQEAVKYIKYLRAEVERLETKSQHLEENIKSAFAKAQYFERTIADVNNVHNQQHAYIVSSLHNLIKAIESTTTLTQMGVESALKGGA